MSVFICDKDMLAVFDKFLAGFYGSHMQGQSSKCSRQ